jgi:hypothetical protein
LESGPFAPGGIESIECSWQRQVKVEGFPGEDKVSVVPTARPTDGTDCRNSLTTRPADPVILEQQLRRQRVG